MDIEGTYIYTRLLTRCEATTSKLMHAISVVCKPIPNFVAHNRRYKHRWTQNHPYKQTPSGLYFLKHKQTWLSDDWTNTLDCYRKRAIDHKSFYTASKNGPRSHTIRQHRARHLGRLLQRYRQLLSANDRHKAITDRSSHEGISVKLRNRILETLFYHHYLNPSHSFSPGP
jgi:hypothetical protein